MKLLRDVVRGSPSDDDTAGRCHLCGWNYSMRSERLNLIRHFEGCEYFNEDGIAE